MKCAIVFFAIALVPIFATYAANSNDMEGDFVFDAEDYRNDDPCGLDVDKIYQTLERLRKIEAAGQAPLTVVTMHMAIKDKLSAAIEALAVLHQQLDEAKNGSGKRIVNVLEKIGAHRVNLVLPLQKEVSSSGQKIMELYGIEASQLAKIPGFRKFKEEHSRNVTTTGHVRCSS